MNKLFLNVKESPLFLMGSLLVCFCLIPFIKLPIFAADYWFSKWVVVYAATFIFAIIICFNRTIVFLPKVTPSILVGLSLLVLLTIFNHLNNAVPFLSPAFWDRLAFALLSLSFFNIFKQNKSFICIFLGTLFIANALFIITCLPDFCKFINLGSTDRTLLHQNFGNINMSAEFVGICLILLISGRGYFPRLGWLIDTLTYFSIIYCYYASSRSIAVALGFSLIVLICFKIVSLRKVAKYLIVSILILVCMELLSQYSLFMKGNTLNVNYIKSNSTLCRWQIIESTLQMIRDHPLGVGPGNYLFSFIPYLHNTMPFFNEARIVQTPHNEYLRIIAEDGIPFTLILLGMGFIYLLNNKQSLKSLVLHHPTIIGFFSFLAVQAAFQFPLVNGFPFLITACFVGYTLSVLHTNQVVNVSTHKWLLSISIVGSLLLGGIISESASFLYFYSSPINKIAYKLNGNNWQAAVHAAEADMVEGNLSGAHQLIDQELKIHPHNYIALSVKAHLYAEEGNIEDSCLLLKKIDDYFMNKSSHYAYILQNCGG